MMICFIQTRSFLLHKMLIDGLEWCGVLVGYRDVFNQLFGLSFWRHPFTAEDPLLGKWCNASLLQINIHIGSLEDNDIFLNPCRIQQHFSCSFKIRVWRIMSTYPKIPPFRNCQNGLLRNHLTSQPWANIWPIIFTYQHLLCIQQLYKL